MHILIDTYSYHLASDVWEPHLGEPRDILWILERARSLAAAEALAPVTYSTHIKEYMIHPKDKGSAPGSQELGAPGGAGGRGKICGEEF